MIAVRESEFGLRLSGSLHGSLYNAQYGLRMVVVTDGKLVVSYAVDGFYYSLHFAPSLCFFS